MPEKDLRDYVKEARRHKVPESQIRKKLIEAGWSEEHIKKALARKKFPIFTFITILLIAFLLYTYFFILSPTNVEKPQMERPPIQQAESNVTMGQGKVGDDHVEYIVNELGGYKLHDEPLSGEPPVIEFIVSDTKDTYSVIIEDNVPIVKESDAKPDLRISGDAATLLRLCSSKSLQSEIVPMVKEGTIQIEIITDEKTLALKGYKSIYDSLNSGMPTGNAIRLA
ncbi:MAG: hypothetical protein NDI94_02485 [Candidatus Woesearchaeota archaeon]|nr:hypothetical protein [Candidatus Woesearchaeota archaeon]